jgi:hypothetical protein
MSIHIYAILQSSSLDLMDHLKDEGKYKELKNNEVSHLL